MALPVFSMPPAICYGHGAVNILNEELKDDSIKRIMLITDPVLMKNGTAQRVIDLVDKPFIKLSIFSQINCEPSIDDLEFALYRLKEFAADLVIGLGGGSVLDVAKAGAALAANKGPLKKFFGTESIPGAGAACILIPTTAGTGAEVTKNAIFLDNGAELKIGMISRYLLPKAAIVDPELTLTMPPEITAATGMDALTHAIESYTSPGATTFTEIFALEAIRLISHNLRRAVSHGADRNARYNMSMGSLFAGISLANAGVGAVHALAYPLGSIFKIGHGISNALLLPQVMEFNLSANLKKFSLVAEAMGENVAGLPLDKAAYMGLQAVRNLSRDIGIPQGLEDIGIGEDAVNNLAESALKGTRLLKNNPRPVSGDDVTAIYYRSLRKDVNKRGQDQC